MISYLRECLSTEEQFFTVFICGMGLETSLQNKKHNKSSYPLKNNQTKIKPEV